MKNIIRAFALSLVVTGAAASVYASNSNVTAAAVVGKTTMPPIPACPPNDPNGCGMGTNQSN